MAFHGLRTSVLAVFLASAGLAGPVLADAVAQVGPAHVQSNRVADDASLAPRMQVTGHIPAWAKSAADRGAVPDAEQVQLIFTVARTPEIQAAFTKFVDDQQTIGSASYHKWLTPAQVGDQYGPTQHDVDALTAWLASQGFTIDGVTPSRTFVRVSATAATVNTALQTSLHNFSLGAGMARAPLTEPSMPSALGGIVSYIDGLTNVPRQANVIQHGSLPISALTGDSEKPAYTYSATQHFLLPADFNTIYDVKAAAGAGYTGTGQKITIIGGSRLLQADVTNYEALAALPSYTPNAIVGTGFVDPGLSTSDQTEGMLDFERAYGTAPGATIDLVIAQNWLNGTTTQNLLLYAINTVNDPILSLSFGACENLQTPAYVQSENTMYQQAASQGMSVLVSSGDSGAAGCDGLTTASTAYASINDICASGYVTCVGGTQFNDTANYSLYWATTNGTGGGSALSYIPEGAWNEPSYVSNGVTFYQASSTGGGFSTNIAKPSFQVATGVPADGARDVPDISFAASNHTSYFLCQAAAGVSTTNPTGDDCVKSFGLVGGTSAAAPSMAGIAAILDQRLGGRQGNLNPLLYKLYASSAATAFHDATPASSGVASCSTATPSICNNSVPVGTTSATPVVTGYGLTTGFDLATGLGSLDVNAFLASAVTASSTTTTLSATPSTINTAQTVKFTATLAGVGGTPTGTVQFLSNGVALGAATPLIAGTATTPAMTFAAAGTYAITAVYSGDANFAASTSTALSFVVTVPLLPLTSTTLTVTPANIAAQGSTVLVANVSSTTAGTPTGSVTFLRNIGGISVSLGTGTIAAGQVTVTATNQPAGIYNITAVYAGDANFSTSTSAAVPFVVTALPTTTTVALTPASGNTLTSFIATATVTPVAANTTAPTGTVQFYVDGVAKGTPLAIAAGSNKASSAAFILGLSTGSNDKITAIYSGDTIFATSTSAAASPTVVAAPFFTISPASTSLTVASSTSGSVSDVLTAITNNGFTGSITYACVVALTSGTASVNPGCVITPSTVVFPATATLTISTIAPHAIVGGSLAATRRVLGTGGLAFAGLFLLAIPAARRRRNWRALAMLALFAVMLFGVSGCGNTTVVPQPSGGTTTGSYIVTVTATTTTGIPPATVNINLTVN